MLRGIRTPPSHSISIIMYGRSRNIIRREIHPKHEQRRMKSWKGGFNASVRLDSNEIGKPFYRTRGPKQKTERATLLSLINRICTADW